MVHSSIFLMLQTFEVLDKLTREEMESLSQKVEIKRVERNRYIYESGSDKNYVYLLRKGSVKLGANSKSGKVLIKEVMYENSIFGENILVQGTRKEFALALSESSYIRIPASFFQSLLEKNNDFAGDVMSIILKRIEMLEDRMESFVFKKAEKRIVEFLRKISQSRGSKIGDDEVLLQHSMSHREIARLTDTSRQTVARVLSDLKKDNIIHFSARRPNKIVIRDMMKLA